MSYKIHNGTLFNYQAGVCCGVLVKKNVMKKLAKLQCEHLEKVKRVLADGADDGDVFPYMWTLHYPNGNQTTVTFIDTSAEVKRCIDRAVMASSPCPCELVFVAGSMKEAQAMADERCEEKS